jgi:hypothetical protein
MLFLCVKYEHSCMSFKNNVLSFLIFKILNMYKYHSYYYNTKFIRFFLWTYKKMDFTQNLYEPMKIEFRTKFVQIYETWYVCDDIYTNIYDFFAHFKLIWDYLCKCKFKGICHVFASLMYYWKKQNVDFFCNNCLLNEKQFYT